MEFVIMGRSIRTPHAKEIHLLIDQFQVSLAWNLSTSSYQIYLFIIYFSMNLSVAMIIPYCLWDLNS